MTLTSVGDILKFILTWENSLGKYYGHLQRCLVNERSRTAIKILNDQQDQILAILSTLDIKEYTDREFVQNIPDYHKEEIIASLQMSTNCPAAELFERILDCEEKLESFYTQVRSILVSKKSKELFDLLIQLKVLQIREIKELMGYYDMAVG